MNHEIEKRIREMIEANRQALVMLFSAISQQIDPGLLEVDLQNQIALARQSKTASPLAIEQANAVLRFVQMDVDQHGTTRH